MGTIRVKIELNKGRRGIPIQKLSKINEEIDMFVRSLAKDLDLETIPKEWIAHNFQNGSVAFEIECQREASRNQVVNFTAGVREATDVSQNKLEKVSICSTQTLRQFARIADPIEPDETIDFSTYDDEKSSKPIETFSFTRKRAETVKNIVDKVIEYEGSIFGTIHLLNNGANPPYFDLRDLVSGGLVKCYYNNDKVYRDVVKALNEKKAKLYASGLIRVLVLGRKVEWIKVKRIELAPKYKDGDINKLHGSLKNLGKNFDTNKYLAEYRGKGGAN